jgi:uncharacterized protein YxjI
LKKKSIFSGAHYDVEDTTGIKLGEANLTMRHVSTLQFAPTFTVTDTNGSEVMHLEMKMPSTRLQFTFFDPAGAEIATIKKKILKFPGDEFWIEKNGVETMRIYGNFTEHDYQMEISGGRVASVHKKWFSTRDQLGVSITGEVDHRVILGAVIVIEHVEVTQRHGR